MTSSRPQGAQTWITNNTMPAFSLHSHSPDGATTDCGDNIKLQITTHLSTPKG